MRRSSAPQARAAKARATGITEQWGIEEPFTYKPSRVDASTTQNGAARGGARGPALAPHGGIRRCERLLAALAAAALLGAGRAQAQTRRGPDFLPNLPVVDQDGRRSASTTI